MEDINFLGYTRSLLYLKFPFILNKFQQNNYNMAQ